MESKKLKEGKYYLNSDSVGGRERGTYRHGENDNVRGKKRRRRERGKEGGRGQREEGKEGYKGREERESSRIARGQ